MRRLVVWSVLTALAWLLMWPRPGFATAQADVTVQWTQAHFDAAHRGFNARETILSPTTVGGLVTKWSWSGSLDQMASPLVTNDAVYAAGAQDGFDTSTWLFAFDRQTGSLLWPAEQPDGDTISGIAVLGKRVLITTLGDEMLRAYDRSSGGPLWSFPTNGAPSPPTVAGGTIYVQAYTQLYAIDPLSGQARWTSTNAASGGTDSPAVAGGRVFTASVDGD